MADKNVIVLRNFGFHKPRLDKFKLFFYGCELNHVTAAYYYFIFSAFNFSNA